jgi:rare lipoprotein A
LAERARRHCAAAALLALAVAGGAAAADEPQPPDPAQPQERVGQHMLRGIASWYGKQFHGRRTASGVKFDMNALTAAHPTLPFNTRVEVRNLDTGRTVEVRITDRGPYLKQRIIDLSQAAARAIGLGLAGAGRVQLTVLDPADPLAAKASPEALSPPVIGPTDPLR